MKYKNMELASEFLSYCIKHPDERFWQALRNWSGQEFIFAGDLQVAPLPPGVFESSPFTPAQVHTLAETLGLKDTFFWEEKLK